MSEEVENTEESTEETSAESTESTEVQSDGAAKKKKVNQLSTDELKKKISEMQEKNLTESRYYKHLNQRLAEVEGK